MDLKSRINLNYRWRLFLPTVGLMWLVMAILVFYHYKSETSYKAEEIRGQVERINQRIISAYDKNNNNREILTSYLDFIEEYYKRSPLQEVNVVVVDPAGHVIDHIGDVKAIPNPTPATASEEALTEVRPEYDAGNDSDHGRTFYYASMTSNDGQITVRTALPNSPDVTAKIANEPNFWIIITIIAIAMTAMAYFSTHYLSRSVRLLKRFADKIDSPDGAGGEIPDFPHDELGDISRRIVQLYREKDDAIKRSEREHEVAIHAVEERALLKRQLTNNLNHELKTPIGVIRGYLDTILSSPDMDAATKDRFLQRTHEHVERLCSMLDDISSITRLEEAGNNIPMADVDFHELIFNIDRDLEASGICGDMQFVYDIPVNCHIRGNSNLLAAMISNLIKNSALHSHGTTMGIKLIIESKKFYTFAFWDDGTGVNSDHLPRLFERFYRVDSGRSRKAGGTGLGLPIVKNTIEAHGGTISVHNRASGGLQFIFTLQKFDVD